MFAGVGSIVVIKQSVQDVLKCLSSLQSSSCRTRNALGFHKIPLCVKRMPSPLRKSDSSDAGAAASVIFKLLKLKLMRTAVD